MAEIREDLREWRKNWSHVPTPIPPDATGLWYSEECVDQMLTDYAAAQGERIKALEEVLKDPDTVHVNILRGTIALTKAQAIHIAGLPANIEERIKALEDTLQIQTARIDTLIKATCERCERGDALYVEPSTGRYTHCLGGNYCGAHRLHNLLNTEAGQKARGTL
jgi:hypothetical protein